jgi:hypothetical protein
LDERIITKEDGQYYVKRKKLSMIHFSGVSESNPTSHLENFYSLEKEISSELQGSLVNFTELSHEWLNYQFNVFKRHEDLIVRVLNLRRKTFSQLSFFKRAKKIEQLRSGKLIESRSNFISRQINKIGYKMDLILSNSNSYKYGRTYISSDLKKIRLLFNRFVP